MKKRTSEQSTDILWLRVDRERERERGLRCPQNGAAAICRWPETNYSKQFKKCLQTNKDNNNENNNSNNNNVRQATQKSGRQTEMLSRQC